MSDLFIDQDGVYSLTRALQDDVRTVESGGAVLSDGMDAMVEVGATGDLASALSDFVAGRRTSAARIASQISNLAQLVDNGTRVMIEADARIAGHGSGQSGGHPSAPETLT